MTTYAVHAPDDGWVDILVQPGQKVGLGDPLIAIIRREDGSCITQAVSMEIEEMLAQRDVIMEENLHFFEEEDADPIGDILAVGFGVVQPFEGEPYFADEDGQTPFVKKGTPLFWVKPHDMARTAGGSEGKLSPRPTLVIAKRRFRQAYGRTPSALELKFGS